MVDPIVTGIILAGGTSTRFGDSQENKALATFEEQTLLERVSATVDVATDDPPVVVTRTAAQQEMYEDLLDGQDVVFARDAPPFEGPLAGVLGGVQLIDTPWVFVCGCDMPLLSADGIRWLHSRLARVDSASLDALAVEHPDGTVEPMHTLYRRAGIRRVLRTAPSDGGVRTLLSPLDAVRTIPATEAPTEIPLAASLTNVNTRAELAAARSTGEN
jgi:molybdopterin-guanine dinucleotide biosynthesis protein A